MANINFSDEEIETLAKRVAQYILPFLKELLKQDDEVLDFKQACEFLKCNKSWLYAKVRFREIPYIKVGKYLKFSKKELIKWLKKN